MSSDTIRVFLADDQALVRSGFRMLIDSEDDLEVTGEAPNGADTVAALLTSPADVVLMDIRMPDMDGVEATRRLLDPTRPREHPLKVLVLTTFNLDDRAATAIRHGASGFLLKDITPEMLADAIRTVHAGNAVLAPQDLAALLDGTFRGDPEPPPGFDGLSEREREVFGLVARGLSNAEIGSGLYMSESTVKSHVGAILRKLGLRDRVQVVVAAYEHGLVGRDQG